MIVKTLTAFIVMMLLTEVSYGRGHNKNRRHRDIAQQKKRAEQAVQKNLEGDKQRKEHMRRKRRARVEGQARQHR